MTIQGQNGKQDIGLAERGKRRNFMPTIDELLSMSKSSASPNSLCHENTQSTAEPEQKVNKNKSSMLYASPFSVGDKIVNVNSECIHYGSKGVIIAFNKLPEEMGEIAIYKTTNSGKNWEIGQTLKKTINQLDFDSENEQDLIQVEEEVEEEVEHKESEDMKEYKEQYYSMSVGSLKAIMHHAKDILDYLDNHMVKQNLTAPHLQGMIAVAEDHMRSIHDFVMFVETDDDDYEESESEVKPVQNQNVKKIKKVKISDLPHYEYQHKSYPTVTTTLGNSNRPGLWENIRKKKERMGKKYRPAKPGDKDRPDSKQWKKLTK